MKANYFNLIIALIITSEVNIIAQPQPLDNPGNSCYINSVIQTLYNMRPLTQLLQASSGYDNKRYPLAYTYSNIVSSYGTPAINNYLRPLSTQASTAFCGQINAQQDATEFLIFLIDQLVEGSAPKIKAQLKNIFEITLKSQIRCPALPEFDLEQYESNRNEIHHYLTLEIPKIEGFEITLEDCLQAYFSQETLEEYQGQKNCTKKLSLFRLPKYALLSIKRYKQTDQGAQRIKDSVTIPATINLGRYFDDQIDLPYHLTSAIVQTGDLTGGHFVAYVQPEGTTQWWYTSDTTINAVTPVQAFAAANQNGYLFVYKRGPAITTTITPPHVPTSGQQPKELTDSLLALKTELENLRIALARMIA